MFCARPFSLAAAATSAALISLLVANVFMENENTHVAIIHSAIKILAIFFFLLIMFFPPILIFIEIDIPGI